MGWKVSLNNPVVLPTGAINQVSISTVGYNNDTKRVWVNLDDLNMTFTVWKGSEYDAIGQWTDDDIAARIKVLADNGTLLKQYNATRPKK